MSSDKQGDNQSRRSFVKKAAYVAPVIITLDAMPAFASHDCRWSPKGEENKKEKKQKKEKKEKNGA